VAAIVGLLHLKVHVAQAMSLKDKRRILKGFKDRTRNRYNVSIAEVDGLQSHRSSVLAIVAVSNDHQYTEGILSKITKLAENHHDMILIEQTTDWL